jgi:hypothetical protein
MDGLTFSGLTSASLRLFTADRSGDTGSAQTYVPLGQGPVDSVEIANAVGQPQEYDAVRMALERELYPERIPTSLWGLLEAMTQFYQETLQKAQETRPDFFDQLKEASDKLAGAKDAQDLQTMGQLVAASSPQDMDKFLGAAKELTQKLLGQESQTQEPGSSSAGQQPGSGAEGLEFKTSDVKLTIQPLGENKVAVEFEGAKLQVQDPSGRRPTVELNAKAGQFTVQQTQKAEN